MIYYDYPVSVRYSDLTEDNCLSDTAILDMMQEAALVNDPCETGTPETQTNVWVLCGWKFRVYRRPGWEERLTVRTWLRGMAHHTCDRDFIITDETGEKVVSATSRWLLLDCATGKVANVTDEILRLYAFSNERALDEDIPDGKGSAEGAKCVLSYTVMRRDIDTLHHMNNIHYLTLAREALPAELSLHHFENIEIIYKRQIKLGETVHFCYSSVEGKHLVEVMDSEECTSHALIRFF